MPDTDPRPARLGAEQALRRLDRRLAVTPDDIAARFERARLLDRLGRRDAAREAYLGVLARDMGHLGALLHLAILLQAGGFAGAARTVLEQAVASDPDAPAPRVALGHLLREAGADEAALLHYAAALRADPGCAEAHQGMSYLQDGRDEAAAAVHRARGFAGRVLTTQPFRGEAVPVGVLRLVSARGGNVPTRHLLNDTRFLTHTLVTEYAEPGLALPPHALVFNAIGDAERCGEALDRAQRLLAGRAAPVVNDPQRVRATTRADNAAQLGRLDGVVAPRLATVGRAALAGGLPDGFAYPVLLRSPGFHTGQHFLRVEHACGLERALAILPGESLSVIEALDARGADGMWRKYRVMCVGGTLLPLHLAIAPQWKVHHFTADMAARPADRAEEAAFLDDMATTLGPAVMAALARIARALGLDYGGIDFAVSAQGRVLLFEANATMTVAPPVPGSIWGYRAPAVAAVLAAVQDMLLRKAGCAASAAAQR